MKYEIRCIVKSVDKKEGLFSFIEWKGNFETDFSVTTAENAVAI
jgi:hypothetical protein